MEIRTDLAAELRTEAMNRYAKENKGEIDGIVYSEKDMGNGIKVSTLDVTNDNGERELKKKKGRYVTVSYPTIANIGYEDFIHLCDVLADNIKQICFESKKDMKSLLVCGLGNRDITSDAIGPKTVDNTLVTRHIKEYNEEIFNSAGFFDICAISPGVMAQTGMEALETLKSAVGSAKPDLVIAVDALAARETQKLAKTVQICNTGISPGSGIGNYRASFDESSTGVPVIAVGVPTVVDTATLVYDAVSTVGMDKLSSEIATEKLSGLFVSPKEIDEISENTGKLIGYAINRAFHGNISYEEMAML